MLSGWRGPGLSVLTSADGTFDIFSGNVPRLREDRIKKNEKRIEYFSGLRERRLKNG